MIRRIKRLARLTLLRVQRKGWIQDQSPIADETHLYPNHDLRRHEATDCWCGPTMSRHDHGDGDCWHVKHHSLDGREVAR